MRGAWIVAAAVVVGVLTPRGAWAGVYFTSGTLMREFARPDDPNAQELWPWPSQFGQFQMDLADYRDAVLKGPLHEHYKRRVAELEARVEQGLLSLDDRINLGAYYIRLHRFKDAIRVLEAEQRSRHFLVQANLATAYELADPKEGGNPELARRSRSQALDYWPKMYAGWDSRMLNFYRKAEQAHLALFELRLTDPPPQKGQPSLRLDNLFPRVRFVGPSGKYEAGTIAPKQWGEVPYDAVDLVMQLHLWLPLDHRLSWLLGELLNALGDVSGAAAMMKQVDSFLKESNTEAPKDFRDHYEIVRVSAAELDKFNTNPEVQKDRYWQLKLLCVVAPRGLGLGAGDLIQEASWPLIVKVDEARRQSQDQTAPDSTPSPPTTMTGESWVPNWRHLAVGFGAGALVALLLVMQFRQMGRSKG